MGTIFESKDPFRKSAWRGGRHGHGDVWSFYCPLCNASRRIPYRPRPGGVRQISQVLLTTAFSTLATWNWLSWKGVVVIVPFWTVFEVVYRLRLRSAVNCPHCGFDPYLYMADLPLARKAVEMHWRKKYADLGVPYPGDVQTGTPSATQAVAASPAAVKESAAKRSPEKLNK